MELATEKAAGLWAHIISHTPEPERDELASLVGRKLIDSNRALWEESTVLQSILVECNRHTQKGNGRKFAAALSYSKTSSSVNDMIVYSQESEQLLKSTGFGVDLASDSIECITKQLELENALLEGVVQQLQAAVDLATLEPAPPSKPIVKKLPTGSHLPDSGPASSPARPAARVDSSSTEERSPTSHADGSPRPSSNTGKGKFRSRLLDARTEMFLSDDS